jgi:uncharacterized protein YciI
MIRHRRESKLHYLLFYEKAPGFETKQAPYQAEHGTYVRKGLDSGAILLAGSLDNPNDGAAILLFDSDSASPAEAFAKNDPYVIHGIVNRWHVRPWHTI